MAKAKARYVCQSCGYESPKWLGRCMECQGWNTLVEELPIMSSAPPVLRAMTGKASLTGTAARPLHEIATVAEERIHTGINEFDRVLGGGIVPGSMVLLGGEPGIGKSTLVTAVARNLAEAGKRVLYVSGEESARQIKLRADRMHIKPNNDLLVLAETDLAGMCGQILAVQPDWAIIDSIQSVYDPELSSVPGSVSQVREATNALMRVAKQHNIALCIIGHVTKEGTLAGPKVLEHMVDTVLTFEGDRFRLHRILRANKNRFGSTNEVGLFEMHDTGLSEVLNPSELFLSERPEDTTGSAVVVTLEGTRPLLVEVQALVSGSSFAAPRRATTGFDYNRLLQMLAVLEKRVGLSLSKHDVHVNVVGGLRIDEPAADLGVALAVVSSARDLALDRHVAFIGEVGLGGEVRAVSHVELRVQEAARLGFKKAVVPQHSAKGLKVKGIEIVGVARVMDAIVKAFGKPPERAAAPGAPAEG